MIDSTTGSKPADSPWDEGLLWRIKFALAFQIVAVIVGATGFFVFMLIVGRNPVEEFFGERMMLYDALITSGMLFFISLFCAGKSNPARRSTLKSQRGH